jgi:cyclopropane fatty-acyl-phospholipid synthase-like methyltransferase
MRVQRGINRKPLGFLPRLGQKLSYFIATQSYRKHYQPLIGQDGTLSAGERECETRWNNIRKALEPLAIKNLLDIGCGEGYYVVRAARELGCYALGIEADRSRVYIAQNQISYLRVDRATVVSDEVSLESIDELPTFDAVLFLSVVHHIMFSFGEDYCRQLMKRLRGHIKKALIFEMGQSDEVNAKWAKTLPDMGVDPHAWIQDFLFSCGYKNVRKIALVRSYFGDSDRAMFIAN